MKYLFHCSRHFTNYLIMISSHCWTLSFRCSLDSRPKAVFAPNAVVSTILEFSIVHRRSPRSHQIVYQLATCVDEVKLRVSQWLIFTRCPVDKVESHSDEKMQVLYFADFGQCSTKEDVHSIRQTMTFTNLVCSRANRS